MSLQSEVNELQDEMMLKDVQGELAELENDVHSLERDLAELRAKGYAVEKNLEGDIKVLASQWDRIRSRTEATLEHQTQLLSQQMTRVHADLATLMGMTSNLNAARPRYVQLKSAIASAEAQADAAEDTVLDQYDEYADEVESLSAHFDWVDWMLAALSTASFRLLATESGVAATEAVWERPGLEPENGILFLTDQRLLWEDRVGEFELKITLPLQQVIDAKEDTSEDGEFEVLVFEFDSAEVPVATARFQLVLPVADDWLKMVGRARSGDFAQDRAIKIDEDQLERIRNAPIQCPNCGAAFTAPVLRGQSEIVCEFCGVATRL
jgi:prefoldin subunit 5